MFAKDEEGIPTLLTNPVTQTIFTPSATVTAILAPPTTVIALPAVDPSNPAIVVTNGSAGQISLAFGTVPNTPCTPNQPGTVNVASGQTVLLLTEASAALYAAIAAQAAGSVTVTRGAAVAQSVFG